MKTPQIRFRTKVKTIMNADGSTSEYIDYKKKLSRVDCNLRPHEHTYYNSYLFLPMLHGAYQTARQGRDWVRLTDLPECVKVDATGFLAEVTVTLPETFK